MNNHIFIVTIKGTNCLAIYLNHNHIIDSKMLEEHSETVIEGIANSLSLVHKTAIEKIEYDPDYHEWRWSEISEHIKRYYNFNSSEPITESTKKLFTIERTEWTPCTHQYMIWAEDENTAVSSLEQGDYFTTSYSNKKIDEEKNWIVESKEIKYLNFYSCSCRYEWKYRMSYIENAEEICFSCGKMVKPNNSEFLCI